MSVNNQFIKIRFPDKPSRVNGVYQLMKKTKVFCLANEEYVIAGSARSILEENNIRYENLGEAEINIYQPGADARKCPDCGTHATAQLVVGCGSVSFVLYICPNSLCGRKFCHR